MIFNIVTYKQVNKKRKAPFIHHVLQHHQSKKPIIVSPLFEWIYLLYSQTSGVPSRFAVLKDVPQPHDAMAFGLSIVKPPPISDCL